MPQLVRAVRRLSFVALLVPLLRAQSVPAQFESPQTNALAVSADGLRLVACNTPDHRIAWFSLARPSRPVLLREIAVALEPVAVALAGPHEAWVVCHLCDAVQVVDLERGVVTATLSVGDEPAGITIARGRAFVTSATRREVVAFDVANRVRLATIPLFGDEPRWLARSGDGGTVWVAAHKSGNGTTSLRADVAPPQPSPADPSLPAPPRTARIIDHDDPAFAALHDVDLPDHDVFAIDTATLAVTRRYPAVGTLLFGLGQRPGDGRLYVANTEARNRIVFEPSLRGHVVDSRVTRIDPASGGATVFDLNPAIDHGLPPDPVAVAGALAQPTDVAFAPDGSELYVAAFGSDRVAFVDPDTGAVLDRVAIGDAAGPGEKRGPRSLAVGRGGAWLYVLNRLSNTLSVVDVAARVERGEQSLGYDPTPPDVVRGRGVLYDAKLSSHGTASCAVCHVDATTDNLAWDLGDPFGAMTTVPGIFGSEPVHPMKGPMLTQTLLGLDVDGMLHWRGDRLGLGQFAASFDTLLGGVVPSAAAQADFEAFVAALRLPPNPNQNADGSYPNEPAGSSAEEGRVLFEQVPFDGAFRCTDCHGGNALVTSVVVCAGTLMDSQPFRVARLVNAYKRIGLRDAAGRRTSGFGLLHDGTDFDVFALLGEPEFGALVQDTAARRKLAAFVAAIDTGTAPAVGRACTVDRSSWNAPRVLAEQALLVAAAAAGHAGLVARGIVDGAVAGFVYDPVLQRFAPDDPGVAPRTPAELRQLARSGRAVYTLLGVPPGEGERIGVDRDLDGRRDRAELPAQVGAASAPFAPRLEASSPAFVGGDAFALVGRRALPGSAALLLLGDRATTPFDVLGVRVHVAPGAALVVEHVDARGEVAFAAPVPDIPALRGQHLFAQALFVDARGPAGLLASAPLRIPID